MKQQSNNHTEIAWLVALCIAHIISGVHASSYDFDMGATTCYRCMLGKFAPHTASAECEPNYCLPGTYASVIDTIRVQCLECPPGSFCPGGSLSQTALPMPRASLSLQKTQPGLSDFSCRRGFYKLHGLFCCNFNTMATATIQDGCKTCAPGFYYNRYTEMCSP